MDCIFCEILAGRLPSSIVYEDEQVVGLMSLDQPNPYKVLVISRAHLETIYDLTDEQAAFIFQATAKICRAVRDAANCDGLNLVQSNGRDGGQDVFHFHLHIVPRFSGDKIRLSWEHKQAQRSELDEMAEKIRVNLENRS